MCLLEHSFRCPDCDHEWERKKIRIYCKNRCDKILKEQKIVRQHKKIGNQVQECTFCSDKENRRKVAIKESSKFALKEREADDDEGFCENETEESTSDEESDCDEVDETDDKVIEVPKNAINLSERRSKLVERKKNLFEHERLLFERLKELSNETQKIHEELFTISEEQELISDTINYADKLVGEVFDIEKIYISANN